MVNNSLILYYVFKIKTLIEENFDEASFNHNCCKYIYGS